MELDGLVKPGLQDCKGPGLNWAVGIPCASKMFHNSYSTCKVTVNGRGLDPHPKWSCFGSISAGITDSWTHSCWKFHMVRCISHILLTEANYPAEPVCLEGSFLMDGREAWDSQWRKTTTPRPDKMGLDFLGIIAQPRHLSRDCAIFIFLWGKCRSKAGEKLTTPRPKV